MEKISVEEIEEGVLVPADETVDAGIDMSAEKAITKDEFKDRAKELYEKMSGLTKRTDIGDVEKKTLAEEYTQEIKGMLKPFFAIGLKEVTTLRKKETENMEQLLALYKLIEKYFAAKTTATPEELDKLKEEIVLLNVYTTKNVEAKFFADVDKVLADLDGKFLKSLSSVKIELEAKIISYAMPIFNVEEILNTITPATLKEKARVLQDSSLFNFKKKRFAKFVSKRMPNKEFLKQFKNEADFMFIVAALCKEAIRKVITEDDVAVSYLEEGQTKAEYLAAFKADGSQEINNLSIICALFITDFVIASFSDNTASGMDRQMYVGLLYNRANYDMMREIIVKFVYTIGDITF